MQKTYNVGSNNASVNLSIKVSSAAKCTSEITQIMPDGTRVSKGTSANNKNGSIAVLLGNANDVKNSTLSLQTIADIGALPDDVKNAMKTDVKVLKRNLAIIYTFNQNTTGEQNFNYDNDDYDFIDDKIIVTKEIKLIA